MVGEALAAALTVMLVGDGAGEDGGDGVGAGGDVKIGDEGGEVEAEAGGHSGVVFKNQDAHQTVLAGWVRAAVRRRRSRIRKGSLV